MCHLYPYNNVKLLRKFFFTLINSISRWRSDLQASWQKVWRTHTHTHTYIHAHTHTHTHTYTGKFIFCLCIALDIKIAILRQFGQKMFLRQQIGLTPSNIAFTMFVSVCSNLRVSRVYLEIRLLLFGNVSVFSVSSKVKLLIKTCN